MHKSDADIRLARRIRRDTVERGRDISSVLDQVVLLLLFFTLGYNPAVYVCPLHLPLFCIQFLVLQHEMMLACVVWEVCEASIR